LIVATVLLMFVSVISQPVADNIERCYQNLEGDCYYVLDKKYPGIEAFEFFWVDEIDRANFLLRGAAYVDKIFYKFEGTVKGNRISFAVSVQGGIAYRFVGVFLPGGRRLGKERIAFEGRLIKLNESKKVKARNVKLFVDFGYNQ
jgi:hypothetical protein